MSALPQGLLDALDTEQGASLLEPDRVESLERLVEMALHMDSSGARVAAAMVPVIAKAVDR